VNLDDYEKKYFTIYQAFAYTIRSVLENALLVASHLPRPQSIQYRAKGIDSLRRRLEEANKLDTQTLELDRRDLAGVRLIFYTNNDVDRFLASSVIRENFEIEEDSTKIHHPIAENGEAQYRAIHYTVRLREDRVRLPEYARFSGLRCEIQIQTILHHAWAETSHDILYKDKLGGGYGERAMKDIARRFEQIMEKYLIPAGFEIQKAQQDFERVRQGKELFDKNITNLLENAQNNNERYEVLLGLRDYAIPNYDDPPAAYEELKGPLLRVVKAARATEPLPIETTYGSMEGFKVEAVTQVVIEVIQRLRYADVSGTLKLLIDIYQDEANADIRQLIEKAVKDLSEYNIEVYDQIGLQIQLALMDHLATMTDPEIDSILPIALIVWNEAIQSDITGTKWKADSVVLSTGAIPVSDQLRKIREKAIGALFAAYDRSTDFTQKRAILTALEDATRTPHQTQYSNDLLAITLNDATRIVDFVTERAKTSAYDLLQHLEHQFHYDYFRAQDLIDDPENKFGCQAEAAALKTAIFKFRDTINADEKFVRYKVLVGFESVYPEHWLNKEYDYQKADDYRNKEAELYIDEINAATEGDWFSLVAHCAETKSNDLATFPVFGKFISKLAERKPEIADRFLANAPDGLRGFLTAFLNGFAVSARSDIYERILEAELQSAKNLIGVARHLRYSQVLKPEFIPRLLQRAIESDDVNAVTECLLFSLESYGTDKILDPDTFFDNALAFLNSHKDPRWVSWASIAHKPSKFYDELTPNRMAKVLQNLEYLPKVNYQAERILICLANRHLEAVWDYFGTRLTTEINRDKDQNRFEAIPFRFHGLEKELSKDPQLAIRKGLSWFAHDRKLFRFRGGRLLSNAFPNCTAEFANALVESIKLGQKTEIDFALEILQNYEGEPSTHSVLKEIVSRCADDAEKMSAVRICIDSTGVVSGELGFADAWRNKKNLLTEWLTDERPAVKAFAEKHILELDLMIASEHRRAEAEREMRNRDYDSEE
jgi:ppGpp synthetase/RelA/SpoT-type nucleotidyltranferase